MTTECMIRLVIENSGQSSAIEIPGSGNLPQVLTVFQFALSAVNIKLDDMFQGSVETSTVH